ncbi:hypothetical protein LC724_31750 [Blautia sp. RD014234]|nr:hypothetical protein [Blautia parvula]
MSEEFNEGMNENRGMAEEHKGPEENPSITETPGSVNFTMKEAAEEKQQSRSRQHRVMETQKRLQKHRYMEIQIQRQERLKPVLLSSRQVDSREQKNLRRPLRRKILYMPGPTKASPEKKNGMRRNGRKTMIPINLPPPFLRKTIKRKARKIPGRNRQETGNSGSLCGSVRSGGRHCLPGHQLCGR